MIRRFARLIGATMILFMVGACSEKRGPTVNIVVPTGFRGFVTIAEDRSGIEVPLQADEYSYSIETNGILKVRTLEGFLRPHYTDAIFADGSRLAVAAEGATDQVALYELGASSSLK